MKFSKPLLIAALAITTSGFAVSSLGSEHGRGDGGCRHHGAGHHKGAMFGHRDPERWLGYLDSKLDLSDSQEAEVRTILDSAKASSAPLRQQLREQMRAERDAMESDAPEADIKALARQTADTRVDLMVQMRQAKSEVRNLLTDDQKAKLDDLREERKARMEERMEKFRERSGDDV